MIQFPYTTKPEDAGKLLEKLARSEPPADKVDSGYIKSLGFSANSSAYLLEILKKLGFVNEQQMPSGLWHEYVASGQRGGVLATALKNAYPGLFEAMLCPYLEGDEDLLDFFQREEPDTTPKERALVIMTFRALSGPADFQDLMCNDEPSPAAPVAAEESEVGTSVNVDPRMQVNIQVHIDPGTSDEKIETIFKNMRKYLLGKNAIM